MAYPLFPKPSVVFSGTVDYPQALLYVKEMFSYLNSKGDCCATLPKDALYKLTPLMQAISYNDPTDLDNEARWQDDIKSAYYLLYQYI